ncbi:MAG: methylmalonyl-CoA mutase family protein [Candidatus Tectomicrobia bacterium]|uniref:Methylmalonyl-CoA mutase family protein n=1 Tax=Tectimicrobiota bacterium TaxID=2528274 RepID=A0A933LQH7_UNCTE|nr:methylmalonyl-CoA mutase family protein [Candidatus Tectomicrobia bacterium]
MFDKAALEALRKEKEQWEKDILKNTLTKGPERQSAFTTPSGIPVNTVYSPTDVESFDYQKESGLPGVYPYTRGIQPNMYRGQLWTFRQYAGFGTAEESNQRYKYLLEHGQTGLSVAFDLPTQIGYDSDHTLAQGEVGKVGVAVDSLRDMEILFDGIPLDKVSTSMTINAPAGVLLAMYVAVAQKQGVSPDKLNGTIQNDTLKEYVARGTYIFPPQFSVKLTADTMSYCSRHVPRWNSISISGYHMREAGCTAIQEVAFTLANAIAYIQATIEQGLKVDDFAPRISWIFNTHLNFFEEVAKFRALRKLWAKIMKERFGAQNPRSCMLRTHTQTGGSTLTAQQPENNVVRASLQALAAVLGGVQSMAVSCKDEALGLPTEESERLALRTQQIIAYESGVTETVDPLAGSYYVEYLTHEIERQALEYIEKIDAMGGAIKAIESGYVQQEIQTAAYQFQKDVDSGKRVVVGVNKFAVEEEPVLEAFSVNPKVAEIQKAKLSELKARRNSQAVEEALREVKIEARQGNSIMPSTVEAVKTYATLGEICSVLREVYGEYQPSSNL